MIEAHLVVHVRISRHVTLCTYAAADIDGDTLAELTEERNAADFKDICPSIKQRVKLRRLLTGATGHREADDAKPLPEDTSQQALLATKVRTSTSTFC